MLHQNYFPIDLLVFNKKRRLALRDFIYRLLSPYILDDEELHLSRERIDHLVSESRATASHWGILQLLLPEQRNTPAATTGNGGQHGG